MRFSNGDIFTGTWAAGRRTNGVGSMQYATGARYEGEWAGEVPHGSGVRTEANGDTYEGRWSAGMREGRGVLRAVGLWYDGEWVCDKPHGRGVCLYASGDVLDAEWRSGALVRVFRCGTVSTRPAAGQSLADFAALQSLSPQSGMRVSSCVCVCASHGF
jgi:hypothetical protein